MLIIQSFCNHLSTQRNKAKTASTLLIMIHISGEKVQKEKTQEEQSKYEIKCQLH